MNYTWGASTVYNRSFRLCITCLVWGDRDTDTIDIFSARIPLHNWFESCSKCRIVSFRGSFSTRARKKAREEVLGSTENKATELKQLKCYQLWYPHKRNMLTGEAFHNRYHTVKWVVMKLMWSVRIPEDSRWNKKRDREEKNETKEKAQHPHGPHSAFVNSSIMSHTNANVIKSASIIFDKCMHKLNENEDITHNWSLCDDGNREGESTRKGGER